MPENSELQLTFAITVLHRITVTPMASPSKKKKKHSQSHVI